MNGKLKIVFVVVLAMVFAGVSQPANASASTISCPQYTLCGWDGLNGTGTRWIIPNPAGNCINLPSIQNDRWSSAYNRLPGRRHVILKQHANCQGTSYTILNGGGSDSFGLPAPYGMNNSATSVQFYF